MRAFLKEYNAHYESRPSFIKVNKFIQPLP